MVIGAMGYLGEVGAGAVDVAAMELAGGIGQEVSAEQIKAEAAAVIDKNRERLLAERYRVNGAPPPRLLTAPCSTGCPFVLCTTVHMPRAAHEHAAYERA